MVVMVFVRGLGRNNRVASHLFTGGFVGIGKLPALFGWYIRYGIGIKCRVRSARYLWGFCENETSRETNLARPRLLARLESRMVSRERGRRKSQYFSNIKVRVGWRWGCYCWRCGCCRRHRCLGRGVVLVVVERIVRRWYCDGGGRFDD